MKILFITKEKSVAGSAYSVSYLAKGLAQKGHDVWVGGRKNAFLLKLVEEDKQIKKVHFPFRGYTDWKTARAISKFVTENQIDLVNAQSGQDRSMLVLARLLFGLRACVVFTRRQRPRDEPWLKRFFHLKVAHIVLISDGLKDLFKKKGYPAERLHVIYNGLPENLDQGVSFEEVQALKTQYQIPDRNPVIGCVSRLKEQRLLIRACKFLDENLTLLFVGIRQEQVQTVIDEVKPKQQLIFTGVVTHKDVLRHYRLMDINVLASKMDGFGLSLVEAMAFDIPVMGSNFGGIRSVLGADENGLLFENEDVEGLAQKIQRLLTDSKLRERLINNGRDAYRNKFTLNRAINEYESFFKMLVK